MIQIYIFFIIIYILSIFAHELGHKFLLEKYTKEENININFKKGSFVVGNQEHYDKLTNKQYLNVNLSGVAWGFFPILISVFMFHYIILLLVPAYLIGCRYDIIEILKVLMVKK